MGGSGLGLGLSRELVHKMGGEMSVSSVLDKGTTFTFYLPLSVKNVQAAQSCPFVPLKKSIDAFFDEPSLVSWFDHFHQQWLSMLEPDSKTATSLVCSNQLVESLETFERCDEMLLFSLDANTEVEEDCEVTTFVGPFTPQRCLNKMSEILERRNTEKEDVQAHQWRLLIADDNAVNIQILCNLLEPYCDEMVVVDNGQAVLDKVREEQFDAVLMDVNMPKMSGIDTVKRLRKRADFSALSNLPVFAITADIITNSKSQLRKAGFTQVFSKPVRIASLVNALAKQLPISRHDSIQEKKEQSEVSLDVELSRLISALENIDYSEILAIVDAIFAKSDFEKRTHGEPLRHKLTSMLKEISLAANEQDIQAIALLGQSFEQTLEKLGFKQQ